MAPDPETLPTASWKKKKEKYKKKKKSVSCHWHILGSPLPPCVSKETYVCGKRDLRMWQKRPTYVAKEAYLPDLGCYSTSLRL